MKMSSSIDLWSRVHLQDTYLTFLPLKVLTNEKRGVLGVVLFERSRFNLFSRKFSNKFVLAPSFERTKTTLRTLFLSFESNNCFPITVYVVSETYEKIWETCMPRGEFKHRYWFFTDASNIGRNVSVIWKDLLWIPSSQISGRMYNTVVSNKCTMWKVCRSPILCCYLQTIIDCKWHKQGSLSSFRPPTGWGLQRFLWKSQRE